MGTGGSKQKPGGSKSSNQHSPDRPSPPGKPYLIPGSPYDDPDVITIGWDPPIILGGSRLAGFVVEHKRTGSPYWVKATPLLARHNRLSLSGLEPGMRYQFRVTAENGFGRSEPSPLSEPFVISFSHGGVAVAPMFSTGLSDTIGIENEKVEFMTKVDGTPTPKISWFKDGFEVFSNRRQRVSCDGDISTLVIHQAALSDEGEIKCTATNKAGHAITKARLTLEAPPSIRLQRQYEDGLLFELGEVVRLKVAVSGRPQPDVLWYHNGEELKADGRVEMAVTEKHALVKIADATRLDRGEYLVKAKNSIGNDSASFLVTITDRPLPPESVEVVMTLGRCVTLGWSKPKDDGGCMIGNYIVEYYRIGWNMWLKAATCRQLQTTIGDLIEGSEYKFRVKAENPYGVSDPSDESDTVFIPDPKRGLLEPLRSRSPDLLKRSPKEWVEKPRSQSEHRLRSGNSPGKESGEWTEDDSLPSQVVLAHQILKKVKLAPVRTWSEDSQRSPPRETPARQPPVPPKRKRRQSASREQSSSPPTSPTRRDRKLPPHLQKEFDRVYAQMGGREPSPVSASRRGRPTGKAAEQQERKSRKMEFEGSGKPAKPPKRAERESRTPSTIREATPKSRTPEPMPLRTSKSLDAEQEEIHRKEEELKKKEAELIRKMEDLKRMEEEMKKNEEMRQLSFMKNKENTKVEWGRELSHDIHSSSEMMLVLLPNNDEQDTDVEVRLTADELKERPLVAPPMSLSAPVLGGGELPPPSLRAAVSSTEIMYELTLARLSREANEEEAEANLRQRYGLDRKRSFEKKTPKIEENVLPFRDTTASLENLEGLGGSTPELVTTAGKSDSFTDRFLLMEKSFENYHQKFESQESGMPDVESDMERSFDYYDDVAEETYHPRGAAGVFTPISVQLPSREFAERIPSPQSLGPPPLITISEEVEKDGTVSVVTESQPEIEDYPPTTSIRRVVVREVVTPDRLAELPVVRRPRSPPAPDPQPSPTPSARTLLPKPILKTRDRSSDRSDASDSESTAPKRVRIAEPGQNKENIDLYATSENDVGLQAGEVARNRRKLPKPHQKLTDDPVVVNIYSDIIREYSQMRKPQTKLYLSYEELKEAADKIQSLPPFVDESEPLQTAADHNSQYPSKSDHSDREKSPAVKSTLPRPKKLYVEYLLDLFLFFVALWLYFFKDPRLSIPILFLMIYRQLNETIQARITSFKSWKWLKRNE